MPIPEATRSHYQTIQALQLLLVRTARRSWDRIDQSAISESWLREIAHLLPVVEAAQVRAAFEGATYSAMTLAQQDQYTEPSAFVDVDNFAGYASDGRPIDSLLYRPAVEAKGLIGAGMSPAEALDRGRTALDMIAATQIADVARQAGGVDISTREGVGYVRMLNPPSCPRCTVLAGKWYRWNTGFLRHPRCDCLHLASRAGTVQAALDEGLVDDPYKAFSNLSPADQERLYGKANAAAIRNGADISQVVNSRRGMTPNGNFTTEGTTKRGNAATRLAPGQRRMTPELIYKQAGTRDEALSLLEHHGYVLPGGQNPTGSLRGQREGFGQLGGGGQRRAAVNAIEEARRTGVRDPTNRYTMTAAERRLYDAEQNYKLALSGKSPYISPGFGNTPDPYGERLNRVGASTRPVTQAEMATAEREYRRMLATGGQKFTT